ncbi:MAG: transglutaminase family protein [Verrucomicrobia bacterium]|nr:MAG: transglutaminase family protein [Verrucomicrobiota bacterium]
MKYRIKHRTEYVYEGSVTVSHHLARLTPRVIHSQRCPWHSLEIFPIPVARTVHVDAFGNLTTYFEIEGKHDRLEVIARSFIEVSQHLVKRTCASPAWEEIRDHCHSPQLSPTSEAGGFCYASALVPCSPRFAAYARQDFHDGRPILDATHALMERVNREFVFDSKATDVSTPVMVVFEKKAGVCQDFAHLMIACLRSLGLPARYVSGYLETTPPPGQKRLIGADASHAWVSVYCGDGVGWVDFDPTNNLMPSHRHVTLAWGRDFSDVSPLRGVTLGAGDQKLIVSVDVAPAEEEE